MFIFSLTVFVSNALSQDTLQDCRKPIGIELKGYSTVGHNIIQGVNGALAVMGSYSPNSHMSVGLGIEGCTSGPQAAMLRWNGGFDAGKVHLLFECRQLLNIYFRTGLKEFNSLELATLCTKHWRISAGVGQRFITRDKMLDIENSSEFVLEPFNLMYEVEYHIRLGRAKNWCLAIRLADYDDYVADCAFQPMLSIYTSRKFGDTFEGFVRATAHPTGMFNLGISYFEFFANFGIIKTW